MLVKDIKAITAKAKADKRKKWEQGNFKLLNVINQQILDAARKGEIYVEIKCDSKEERDYLWDHYEFLGFYVTTRSSLYSNAVTLGIGWA